MDFTNLMEQGFVLLSKQKQRSVRNVIKGVKKAEKKALKKKMKQAEKELIFQTHKRRDRKVAMKF